MHNFHILISSCISLKAHEKTILKISSLEITCLILTNLLSSLPFLFFLFPSLSSPSLTPSLLLFPSGIKFPLLGHSRWPQLPQYLAILAVNSFALSRSLHLRSCWWCDLLCSFSSTYQEAGSEKEGLQALVSDSPGFDALLNLFYWSKPVWLQLFIPLSAQRR